MNRPWTVQLQPLLDEVRILSAAAFIIRGRVVECEPARTAGHEFFDEDPLMSQLHSHIYATFHAAGGEQDGGDESLTERLAVANAGVEVWDKDWHVIEVLRGGAVVAEKLHRTTRLAPGEYISHSAPAPVRRGSRVDIRRLRESRDLQQDFYYMFGAALADHFARTKAVRYYFNVAADHAAELVGTVTQEFGRREIPFSAKCANTAQGIARRDGFVLYAHAVHAQLTHAVLHSMLPSLTPLLNEDTPLLTYRLAPGLGFAEDPESEDSFGGQRTKGIAKGLIAAYRAGRDDEESRLAAIEEAFREANIDVEQPHLTADDSDWFGLRKLRFGDAH